MCGSVKRVRTPENIAVVREAFERSPHRSARPHCVSLRLSEARVRRMLHKDLHFHPYKIQVIHALHERDYVNRVNTITMNPELSSKFTLSDHETVTVFVKHFHSKSTKCFCCESFHVVHE